MEQRLSMVTLGVADLARARRFYEALGWMPSAGDSGEIVFFQAGPLVFALWDREKLALDSGVPDSSGFGGITLAHNVRSVEEVDALLAEAQAAGATITRPARATDWGGYSGAFTDLDSHAWEVAHNPFWELADDGSVIISPPSA
jgi:hypothetical protein